MVEKETNIEMSNEVQAKHVPQNFLIREHDGALCAKCNFAHFSKLDKCGHCNGPVEPIKWYSRICIERIAFIFTSAILCSFAYILLLDAPKGWGEVFVGSAFVIFGFYYSANYFLGIGGLKEEFSQNNIPPHAYRVFSFSRYFSEVLVLVGIVVASIIFGAAYWLVRWVFYK